jgi:predicted nuclease of restriction endonuclease-like (RecB) superfamily
MAKIKKQDSPKKIKKIPSKKKPTAVLDGYDGVLSGVVELLDTARRTAIRAVNSVMTATYWEIGRRIVEFEQGGKKRAEYGEELLKQLSADLTKRFTRGFSERNLQLMRRFYLFFPPTQISQTLSAKLPFAFTDLIGAFSLPWSHYVLLISRSRSPEAFSFYHTESLRGGWSVRQLLRQIDSQFYERTALSRNKLKMLQKGAIVQPSDSITAEEEIKDPLVLEFLGLKDEYSESELEEALVHHLERFLLELGNDFAFVARQKRLRVGDEWYRVDLLFFHRTLRCLVVVDLKLNHFTPADAGQMHFYLNYARQHWTHPDENPPVGMILCAEKDRALVHYATDSLPNKVLIREYLTTLPDEKSLTDEINTMREKLEKRFII